MRRLLLLLLFFYLAPALYAEERIESSDIGTVTGVSGGLMFIDQQPFQLTSETRLVLGGTEGKVTLSLGNFDAGMQVRFYSSDWSAKRPPLRLVELLAD